MKSVIISVQDKDFFKLKQSLKQIPYIQKVEEKTIDTVDPIYLASEESLSEDWNSDEDDRYDQITEK